MTTYNEGDFITAAHPDGYTVSGPLIQSASGRHLVLGLPAYPRYTILSLEADGYTITPGKPADLSNPVTEQDILESAIAAARHLNGVTGGETPTNAEYLRGQVELIADAFWRVIDAVGDSGKAAIEARIVEPEPVKVPTGNLATVQNTVTGTLWSQLSRGRWFAVIDGGEPIEADDSEIANVLANGGKVLNEGVEL
ncbi:MAG TPA: hypothetical protein VFU07_07225 [Candidatus Lumbricidophila sp.]|nr:hypothetical protein [Candidatus Lumbricidophila sp.]